MTARPNVAAIWTELYTRRPELLECVSALESASSLLRDAVAAGGMLLLCGNGGSAADCEHIAAELVKACALERPLDEDTRRALREAGDDDGSLGDRLQRGLPALALSAQPVLLTAIANDQGADLVFAQQVVAYGRPGDVLWALTTSGRSANVLHALRTARALGLRTLVLTGANGRDLADACDVLVAMPITGTQAVQELHLPVYHALCLALEAWSFGT